MAWIEKNRTKRGGYNVRWRDLSRRNRKRWARTKAAADALKKSVEDSIALGRDWSPPDAPGPLTLEELLRLYLRAMKRKGLQANTLEQRDIACVGFLASLQRRHPRTRLLPKMLTTTALEDYYDDLLATCAKLTAYQRLRIVEAAWTWLSNDERYGELVPRPRRLDLRQPDAGGAGRVLSWAEVDLGIGEASGWYRELLIVMRFTGLRKGQAMRLEWRDFDLEAKTLRIRGELGKSRQERRGRTVPISPHLAAELAGWGRREGYVISPPGKRRPDEGVLRRIWERALGEEVAAELKQPTHCVRKTFISELSRAGNVDLVRYLVGHSRGLTGDVYNADPAFLMPDLRVLVSRIPPVGGSGVRPLRAQR